MKLAAVCVAVLALVDSTALAQPERCAALVRRDGQITRSELAGYSILEANPPFTAPVTQGEIVAIMCARAELRFGPNDYHVLTDLNVPLYITDGARVVVLEMSSGQLRVRFTNGDATEADQQAFQRSLNQMQLEIQGQR